MNHIIKLAIKYLFIVIMSLIPQLAQSRSVSVEFLNYEINPSTHTATFTGLQLIFGGDSPTYKHFENLIIPETITYGGEAYTVTAIGEGAMRYKSSYVSGTLTLPQTLITIEDEAFMQCDTFSGSLIIPNSVVSIGKNAFTYCRGFDGELVLSNSLTSIGESAFFRCMFTGPLVIPDQVTTIGKAAFSGCSGFTNLTLSNSLTTIEGYAFQICSGLDGSLVIPNSVTSIGTHAFESCDNLRGLRLGKNVAVIGNYAFWGCSKIESELDLPATLTSIGDHAFYNCKKLSGDLILPNSLTSLGVDAFYQCNGLNGIIKIPESITHIEPGTFFDVNIEELYLPHTMEAIGCGGITSGKFKLVVCEATTPPIRYKEENDDGSFDWIFFLHEISNTKLLVPAESIAQYKASPYWYGFYQIEAIRSNIPATEIKLDQTSANLYIGETLDLHVSITPDNATDKLVTWKTSNESIATVDANGCVMAVAVGNATITATAASGISANCRVTVLPRETSPITITIDTNSYDIKVREGNILELSSEVHGGNDSDLHYFWYLDGTNISTEPEISHVMTMSAGTEMATEEAVVTLTATNFGPDDTIWGEATSEPVNVTVYRRPLTPKQLLRKGDGTTHTLIALSEYGDDELARLDYTFVYGYTDAVGEDHIAATTSKRYCRIDEQVFNNAGCAKWCYSQWTYADGSVVTSGKRYLDGSSDETFDASDFSGNTLPKTMRDFTDSHNWIQSTGKGINITIEATSDTKIEVFNMSGVMIEAMMVPTGTYMSIDLGADRFVPDIYIVAISSADDQVIKKVIIK